MRTKYVLVCMLFTLLLASCGGKKEKKSYDEMGSNGLTTRTENLQTNLRSFMNMGIIVGQQYATLEGIGWRGDKDRSDIHSICDDRPGCIGYELAGIESGKKINTDSISFDAIRKDMLNNFRHGALLLATWTLPDFNNNDEQLENYTKKMATYLASIQDGYGIKAPMVLFLYPLGGNHWYDKLSAEDYLDLYNKTAKLLRDADVTNVIFGYSYAGVTDAQTFAGRIADDVDVVNLTLLATQANVKTAANAMTAYAAQLKQMTQILTHAAQERNMAAGLTTGLQGIADSTYFSSILMPVISQSRLSYVMFGANYGEPKQNHCYIPYPGGGNAKINDFMSLYNNKMMIFLKRLNGLYLDHDASSKN
jgi:mannan endo-1,4-beta-mannosidase